MTATRLWRADGSDMLGTGPTIVGHTTHENDPAPDQEKTL
jgi:hypothetical protein